MSKTGSGRTRTLDVRALLARGEDPFDVIMEARAALGPEDRLLLLTPFLPSPLIERLRGEGFLSRPERGQDGSWRTLFFRG